MGMNLSLLSSHSIGDVISGGIVLCAFQLQVSQILSSFLAPELGAKLTKYF
jgi:hypothetical protein